MAEGHEAKVNAVDCLITLKLLLIAVNVDDRYDYRFNIKRF